MKKHSKTDEIIVKVDGEPHNNEEPTDEVNDVSSIQEFIELKKLQNRILGKMLEKINKPENQTKSNNK